MERVDGSPVDSRRPVRVAMIGGGPGAFIGAVHRTALRMAGKYQLVAGTFSRSPDSSAAYGREIGIDEDRLYGAWNELLEAESRLSSDKRAELIIVVTPNSLHVPISKMALEKGFHVVCEKPMARTLAEARELAAMAKEGSPLFALTHTYLGYPMVAEMRRRIANDELGRVRRVIVNYTQGWLSKEIEASNNKQASWRTDPDASGPAGALGDIGTHASSLIEFVTGDRIAAVSADLTSFGAGRKVDDDVGVLFRMSQGAKGTIVASQICVGDENQLTLSVYGTRAGMHWRQECPNTLWLNRDNAPAERIRSGTNNSYLSDVALESCRLPSGHPEGFIEALSNLYLWVFDAVRRSSDDKSSRLPDASLGLSTMAFVDAVLRNASGAEKWTELEHEPGVEK